MPLFWIYYIYSIYYLSLSGCKPQSPWHDFFFTKANLRRPRWAFRDTSKGLQGSTETFYLLENIAFVIIGAKSNDKCEISKRFADFCVLSLKKKRKKKRFYSKGKISKNRIWEGFHNQWIIYTQPDLWFSNHYLTNYTSYITGCWPCSCRR